MSFYTNVKAVGDEIFLRGIGDNGKRFRKKVKYSPTLFLPTKEESKYKTLDGQNVKSLKPGGIRETRAFIDQYKDVSNYNIYGNDNFAFCFIGDNYPDEIEYDMSKLVVANIYIEVASDKGFPNIELAGSPVISIAVKFNNDFYVFGFGEPDDCPIEETLAKKNIKYISCQDEDDLLVRFLDHWMKYSPDIVTGWNVNGFDIPYLYNRLNRVFDQKVARSLSPWRYASIRKFHSGFGKEQMSIDLNGILFLIIWIFTRSLHIPIEKVIVWITLLM